MSGDLGTTNLMLGILAAVSVLEAIVMAAMGIAGVLAFRRVMTVAVAIETHMAPTIARLHAILDDVKGVTSRVREETERVDQAIHSTIDRLEDTAGPRAVERSGHGEPRGRLHPRSARRARVGDGDATHVTHEWEAGPCTKNGQR
jgi:hypothetical protein